jgi:hypothetical protein
MKASFQCWTMGSVITAIVPCFEIVDIQWNDLPIFAGCHVGSLHLLLSCADGRPVCWRETRFDSGIAYLLPTIHLPAIFLLHGMAESMKTVIII